MFQRQVTWKHGLSASCFVTTWFLWQCQQTKTRTCISHNSPAEYQTVFLALREPLDPFDLKTAKISLTYIHARKHLFLYIIVQTVPARLYKILK